MRFLIADDDLVARLAMEDVLRQCGPAEIVQAADGAAAWEALQGAASFDLLCLDLRMPPPDGLELVARLRAAPALRRVPTLLITATADRGAVPEDVAAGLQGFIVKPVGVETVTRVRRVLAQLDVSILEPAPAATARLRIDGARHARYVGAFVQQVTALGALAVGGADMQATFLAKAEACRTAALTLGAPRIEQVIADAVMAARQGAPGGGRAIDQALYWLKRVACVG